MLGKVYDKIRLIMHLKPVLTGVLLRNHTDLSQFYVHGDVKAKTERKVRKVALRWNEMLFAPNVILPSQALSVHHRIRSYIHEASVKRNIT